MSTITKLTQNELETLSNVAGSQIEENYSEYTSIDSNKEKGLIGSLVKKGLIVNGYGGDDYEGYMFYLTEEGFEACKELGISTKHIILFN
jgi:chromosome segregation and condensation protein ScpB